MLLSTFNAHLVALISYGYCALKVMSTIKVFIIHRDQLRVLYKGQTFPLKHQEIRISGNNFHSRFFAMTHAVKSCSRFDQSS